MATISLTPEELMTLTTSLSSIANGLAKPAYSRTFQGSGVSESDSKMMHDFQKRINDLSNLIKRYEQMLGHDIGELENVCDEMMVNDVQLGTFFRTRNTVKSLSSSGGGVR